MNRLRTPAHPPRWLARLIWWDYRRQLKKMAKTCEVMGDLGAGQMLREMAQGKREPGIKGMKITLTVEGKIKGPWESIDGEISVPDNWKPSFEEFCKVRGTLRFLAEKLAQEFEPDPSEN